eukprot:gene34099-38413_t
MSARPLRSSLLNVTPLCVEEGAGWVWVGDTPPPETGWASGCADARAAFDPRARCGGLRAAHEVDRTLWAAFRKLSRPARPAVVAGPLNPAFTPPYHWFFAFIAAFAALAAAPATRA